MSDACVPVAPALGRAAWGWPVVAVADVVLGPAAAPALVVVR